MFILGFSLDSGIVDFLVFSHFLSYKTAAISQLQRSKVNTATREATEALLSTTGITSSSEAAQLLIALSERTSWLLGNDATAEIQRHETNERIVQSLANMYDKIIKTNKHGKKGGTQSLDYTNDFLAFQRDDVSKRTNRFKIMPYGISRVVQGPQMVDSSPGTTNLKDYKGHEFKAGETEAMFTPGQ